MVELSKLIGFSYLVGNYSLAFMPLVIGEFSFWAGTEGFCDICVGDWVWFGVNSSGSPYLEVHG